jgi:hypothetical protein
VDHRVTKIDELRDLIADGSYEIDPVAIAEAIVRRYSRETDAIRRRRPDTGSRIDRRRSGHATQPLAA